MPPIASHLFVLYYGVVAEITPPVCTSAYAAAAIANSNPFKTGISAFTLGLGKIIAPMAFVYAPVLLFVSSTGFNFLEFSYAATSCILGVVALSASVVGFFLAPMAWWERILAAIGGLVAIAPSWQSDLIALAIVAPAILVLQVIRKKAKRAAASAVIPRSRRAEVMFETSPRSRGRRRHLADRAHARGCRRVFAQAEWGTRLHCSMWPPT